MRIPPSLLLISLLATSTLLADGPGKKPQIFTVKTAAKLVKEDGADFLRVPTPDGKNAVLIKWGSGAKEADEFATPPPLEKLEVGQTYTFTVMLRNLWGLEQEAELLVAIRDGEKLLDLTMCEVHQVPMELKEVPIKYGELVLDDLAIWEDAAKRFPHRVDVLTSGGAKTATSPDTGWIHVCSACESGYQAAYPKP